MRQISYQHSCVQIQPAVTCRYVNETECVTEVQEECRQQEREICVEVVTTECQEVAEEACTQHTTQTCDMEEKTACTIFPTQECRVSTQYPVPWCDGHGDARRRLGTWWTRRCARRAWWSSAPASR